jgi:NAD(P)-dependent dehydrogenase (short-subunit alcohol dehydrogenase family)
VASKGRARLGQLVVTRIPAGRNGWVIGSRRKGACFGSRLEWPGLGNGKATAVLFAREGARVLAADINLDAAVETKRIIEREGGICEAVAGNVSLAEDVAAMIGACIAVFGRIDVLHNNVGIAGRDPPRIVGTGAVRAAVTRRRPSVRRLHMSISILVARKSALVDLLTISVTITLRLVILRRRPSIVT